MTKSEKNGTVQSTSSLDQDDVLDAMKNQTFGTSFLDTMHEYQKQYMKSLNFKNTNQVAFPNNAVGRELHEEYEELDNNYINEITKLLSTYTDRETSDSNFDACRIALDNLISTEEIYLMETMFENDLDSLSKENVRIIGIDGGLDIRNGNEEKQLSPKQRNFLRQHLTDDDEEFIGYLEDGGPNIESGTIRIQGGVGKMTGEVASIDEMDIEVENSIAKKAALKHFDR